jgi:hypothetical protein
MTTATIHTVTGYEITDGTPAHPAGYIGRTHDRALARAARRLCRMGGYVRRVRGLDATALATADAALRARVAIPQL